ncbi:HAD family phosphatase [Carnobacteriaceae bacterium zg-84]|uniref:Cof-type HAD-IIB family hydrolase n=1 Tax=Granulicatella sp. zg-84 TaxID=2678503 RepID=UPI0013C1390C|nr:Cof-type HAD-IIB family hydrolase [Granulicatella sp. zg-84]NEW65507.1 Cof-type HAD-IIB family hydrolase [Granulicatella sp. zg-84]QMI85608.1 HAD family phosphatase [Carnobacteriaceae bacterium zg-84]
MIKLIAIDLDGTLLTSDKTISQRNKEVIKQAKEQGIKIVLCTGRPIMGIRAFLEELDLISEHDHCITFNGGLVQVTETEEILAQKAHTKADVEHIYDVCFSVGLPINAIDLEKVYEPIYPPHNRSLYPDIINNLLFEHRDIDSFDADHMFNKVVSCCPQDVLDSKIAVLPETFKNDYTLLKSRPILLEILPKDVDKGYGLKCLCELLNIKAEEVLACGDEENDLAMLTYAGYGVAMGNATQDVKNAAKYITDTNDADGVAKAIELYVLHKGE